MADRFVPLGEIVATHGIEGWLKLKPYNPETILLLSSKKIFLEKGQVRSALFLDGSKAHKGHFLLKFRGTDGIADARKWIGSVLSVTEEALQPVKPGEYYYYQVMGFDVFDLEGRWVGKVSRLWSKPGGDLYVVTGSSKEYLIPAVKEMIEKIDFSSGKMIINPPAGLLDL